jgi:hypothetical protein
LRHANATQELPMTDDMMNLRTLVEKTLLRDDRPCRPASDGNWKLRSQPDSLTNVSPREPSCADLFAQVPGGNAEIIV